MKRRIRAFIDKTLGDVSRRGDIEQLKGTVVRFQDELTASRESSDRSLSIIKLETRSLMVDRHQDDLRAFMGRDKSSPVFVLLGTHDYGNIGDLAINYCEKVFLIRIRYMYFQGELYLQTGN
jgi:exopolysaccharide biosynthesis predicted pyruvyltransferase EpsI